MINRCKICSKSLSWLSFLVVRSCWKDSWHFDILEILREDFPRSNLMTWGWDVKRPSILSPKSGFGWGILRAIARWFDSYDFFLTLFRGGIPNLNSMFFSFSNGWFNHQLYRRYTYWLLYLMVLLMVQKFDTTTLGCKKTVVNHGISYQPQLVQEFFHQQYMVLFWGWGFSYGT